MEKPLKSESYSVVSDSLQPHGLYSPQNSPGQNTGVSKLSLLQGIFLTQGLNPGLLHCRQILYQLSHKWRPSTLEWVPYPFFRGFSWPRNRTGISCIASGFLTNWAIREAPNSTQMDFIVNNMKQEMNTLWRLGIPLRKGKCRNESKVIVQPFHRRYLRAHCWVCCF